jgi:GNAT superfamily N-acetyltransferase
MSTMTHLTAQRRAASPALDLRLGTVEDHKRILYLIDETARWLATLGTTQWQKQWPSLHARDDRVRAGLSEDRTWTVWDGGILAATVTVQDKPDPRLWPDAAANEAVYPCRFVVDRMYAGQGLGAELMDWVGRSARDGYQARWIRIDVWTDNLALHAYYMRQGFEPMGLAPLRGYPAAARFQKSTESIGPVPRSLFRHPLPSPY